LLYRVAILQRRALPRQPPPVGLRQGDLPKHRRTWASSPNYWPLLRADRKPPRAAIATEKHLHIDRHLRPQNRPTDVTASTTCAPDFSPSHEPVTTTIGRRSPRRSPSADRSPPWSMFHGEFPLSPPPKIRPLSHQRASRPFPPPPLTAGHRNRPAPPSPVRQRPGLPCLYSHHGPPAQLGLGPASFGPSAQ
jgi:hypothetical protein